MSWLRRIWLLMVVLGTLVSPRLASAQAPLGLETRVGGLDFAAQVIVGVHDLAPEQLRDAWREWLDWRKPTVK